MDKNENKNEMFCRVAAKRVNNVLNDLRKLRQMADKQYYEYNENEVNKLVNAIEKEFDSVKLAFKAKNKKKFSLD